MDDEHQPQERVLVEDYRGPASTLPPSIPTETQIAAESGVKQGPDTATIGPASSIPASNATDWPLNMSAVGRVLGACAAGGLLPSTFTTLALYGQYPNLPTPLHEIMSELGEFLIPGLAILSIILCAIAIFLRHNSRDPHRVLFRSIIGMGFSVLALIVAVIGYFYLI